MLLWPEHRIHVADQDIAQHRRAARRGDRQVVGAAGGQRGQARREPAVAPGLGGDAAPGQRDHHGLAGRGLPVRTIGWPRWITA